jgi:UDP-N-acetylmuramoyl-L-alanyl-D-glutamate--2,6-diaminopimelate ligase
MSLKKTIKKILPTGAVKAITPIKHRAVAVTASAINGFPARKLKFIGVTGTNGKTSTTIMIAHVLEQTGYKVGMSTTALINDGKKEYENNLSGGFTNATPFAMQKLLKTMRRNGVEWVAVEAGSQGLQQDRLWGFKFAGAVITNLTNEHLDYHGTMQNYAAAKARLFKQATGGVLVTNADDQWADYFYKQGSGTRVTYGKKAKDFRLVSVQHEHKYSLVSFEHEGQTKQLKLKLQGEFNAYNALAATAVCMGVGISFASVKTALAEWILLMPAKPLKCLWITPILRMQLKTSYGPPEG